MYRLVFLLFFVITPMWAFAEEPAGTFECREPGLWMAAYGAEDFAKPYCDACLARGGGDYCTEHVGKEAGRLMSGPSKSTSSLGTSINLGMCGEVDYQIQLIRAWHGRGLDDDAWKPYFEERFDWFGDKERASYPKPAPKLIRALKKVRRECNAMERKYSKYVGALEKVRRKTTLGRSIPTIYDDVEGMSDRVLPWTGNPRSPRSLLLLDPALKMSDFARIKTKPPSEDDRKRFHISGPVPEPMREKEVHVLAQVFQNDSIQRVGFTCVGECEGGYSLSVYLDEDGTVRGQAQDFSACPFVYTSPDGMSGWALQGEVLRDVVGPDEETGQSLAVQHERALCESGTMWVRLSEEKRETTYLDDVALLVGGVEVKPDACIDALAHCADDGQYSRLDEGDTLELRFTIPEHVRGGCDDVEVWADGFYEPVLEAR